VVNETGLGGWYCMTLNCPYDKPELLPEAVRNGLGLTIEPARRPAEFLVVTAGPAK
jgi:hypothetical protein